MLTEVRLRSSILARPFRFVYEEVAIVDNIRLRGLLGWLNTAHV